MPEGPKVLTVYECVEPSCDDKRLSASKQELTTKFHRLVPVSYVPQAESVPLPVAEALYEPTKRLVAAIYQAVDTGQIVEETNAVFAALHTYRQSVPEREEPL